MPLVCQACYRPLEVIEDRGDDTIRWCPACGRLYRVRVEIDEIGVLTGDEACGQFAAVDNE